MSIFTSQVISERTIIIWLIYTVLASIPVILIAGVIVYTLYGCWPLTRYGNNCLTNIQPSYLVFAPMAIGIIIGIVLTIKAVRKTGNTNH